MLIPVRAAHESRNLEQLLRQRSDLWRGRGRPAPAACPSGLDWLDAGLPGGGWPQSGLVELLVQRPGCGELGLLLPLLARCTRAGQPVVLAGPPLIPGAQALLQAGVQLERLLVLQHAEELLWAAEQCAASGLCAALAVWLPPGRVNERAIRRLRLAAESSPGPLFTLYGPGQRPPSSLATLRLRLRPGMQVEVMRGARKTLLSPDQSISYSKACVINIKGKLALNRERA